MGVNPILKPCGLGLKQTISYHLWQNVTYGIRAIAQPEMRERAQSIGVTSEDARS